MGKNCIYIHDNKNIRDGIYIYNLELYKYFMRSHKLTREFNKKILDKYNNIPIDLHISLLKFSDSIFFEASRIIEIIKDYNEYDCIKVDTKYNDIIKVLIKILDINDLNIFFVENKMKINNFSFFKYIAYSLTLLFNSLFVKKYNDKNIFIMYNDKISFEFFKPYEKSSIAYPMYDNKLKFSPSNYILDRYLNRKFISLNFYKKGIIQYFKNRLLLNKSNLPLVIKKIYISKLINLEINTMIVMSLKDKFKNLKNIMGIFDTNPAIDYITNQLNSINIQTICIPHGINFKYKVSYISYGTNIYSLWSQNHFIRMEESKLLKNKNVKTIISGNIVYKQTLKKIEQKLHKNEKKILVIGEYFSNDNYYSSPFNKKTSQILFDTLKLFCNEKKDIKVTIRTRLSDGYYKLAKNYISNSIQLSSPSNSIIEDINNHDLIISVFSNALHEGLLLNKKVLQVNLLGIENYRDLARDGLVYYADTEESLRNILLQWYNNTLPKLDYKKHLELYANNGKFIKINV